MKSCCCDECIRTQHFECKAQAREKWFWTTFRKEESSIGMCPLVQPFHEGGVAHFTPFSLLAFERDTQLLLDVAWAVSLRSFWRPLTGSRDTDIREKMQRKIMVATCLTCLKSSSLCLNLNGDLDELTRQRLWSKSLSWVCNLVTKSTLQRWLTLFQCS